MADKNPPRTKAELEREIAATRSDLADTVAALTDRLDVKTHVRERVTAAVAAAKATLAQRPVAVGAVGLGVTVSAILLIRRSRS